VLRGERIRVTATFQAPGSLSGAMSTWLWGAAKRRTIGRWPRVVAGATAMMTIVAQPVEIALVNNSVTI
jgi:hypothetical protein